MSIGSGSTFPQQFRTGVPLCIVGWALLGPQQLYAQDASDSERPADGTPAQKAEVRLVILERGRGTPVVEAAAEIVGTEAAEEVDEEGRVSLPTSQTSARVRIVAPGYMSLELTVQVDTESPLKVVFLEPRPDRTSAMVVETHRSRKQVSQQSLSAEEIARTPGTYGDPIRALESLPQVSRPKLLDGALIVRGAEPYNTAVYWDGHPIPFLYHFGIWKSVVSPVNVGQIGLIPGLLPGYYGDVLQAVVEVMDRDWEADRAEASADLNLTDGAIGLALPLPLPLKGYTALAAGRFSYLSLAVLGATAVQDPDQLLFPQYWDGSFSISGPLWGGQLRFSGLGALDAVHLGRGQVILSPGEQERFDAFEVDPFTPYETSFGHLHVSYKKTLHSGWSLQGSLMGGQEHQVSLLPLSTAVVQLPALTRLERPVLGARLAVTGTVSPSLSWQAGLEARTKQAAVRDLTALYASSSADGPGGIAEETLLPASMMAMYGRLELGTAETLLWVPELRTACYWFDGLTHLAAEPRLSIIRPLPSGWSVQGGLGLTSQMPEERDILKSVQPLTLMRAVTGSAGLAWKPQGTFSAEGTIYAGRQWGLPLQQTDIIYQETDYGVVGQLVEGRIIGSGLNAGIELSLRAQVGREAQVSASYTLARSLRAVPGGAWRSGDYDQPHSATLMMSGRLVERVWISGRLRIGSGMPFTPSEGVWVPQEQAWFPIAGLVNSARMPLYHQLDLRAERQILKDRYRMTYYVDVQNVYMAKNSILELASWNYEEVSGRIWLPIIPSLGVRADF